MSSRKIKPKNSPIESKSTYKPFSKKWFSSSPEDLKDEFLIYAIFMPMFYSACIVGVYILDSLKIHYVLFLGCLMMIFYQLAFRNKWGDLIKSIRKTINLDNELTLADVNFSILAFVFISADLAAIFVVDYDKIGKAGNYVVVSSLGIGLIRAFYSFVKSLGDDSR